MFSQATDFLVKSFNNRLRKEIMEHDFLFMGSWSFHSEISETNEIYGCPNELRHLSAAIPGGGGGGNPGEIRGDRAEFVNFVR